MKFCVFVAIALIGMSGPGLAATLKATFTGTVQSATTSFSGPDGTVPPDPMFGLSDRELVGKPLTAVFTYNVIPGEIQADTLSLFLIGGVGFPFASPMISAALTINGITQTLDGAFFGKVEIEFTLPPNPARDFGAKTIVSLDDGAGTTGSKELIAFASEPGTILPANLDDTLSEVALDGIGDAGLFEYEEFYFLGDDLVGMGADIHMSFSSLKIEVHDTPPPPPAVPLPAGLPLLVTGLAAGAMLRRRAV